MLRGRKERDQPVLSLIHYFVASSQIGRLVCLHCLNYHSNCVAYSIIGLYTSPHLVAVRERIRINGKPISEEQFAKYFFEVWDRLEANETVCVPKETNSE